MHNHNAVVFAVSSICVLATACTLPGIAAPTATPLILPTPIVLPATAVPASPTALTIPTLALATGDPVPAGAQGIATRAVYSKQVISSAEFCADSQPTTLINTFKQSLQSSNGPLFASLISPVDGMQARLYRDGRVVTYDRTHAKFLFETTYSIDWGIAPGSGMLRSGPFHETILPDLLDVFNRDYTLGCNQLQVGGTTYQPVWPYNGVNFYSVYSPGTQANGNMDWHTWLLGMDYVNNKPYLSAIMQLKWEP